jgi:hypothetical protein
MTRKMIPATTIAADAAEDRLTTDQRGTLLAIAVEYIAEAK